MKKKSKLPNLIGVIHLAPLGGSPGASALHPSEALRIAGQRAVEEARTLVKAGFDGLIIENFGDAPFYGSRVPPETIASMAIIAAAVRESVRVPIGVNVLRNDASAALAIAATSGCDFIRVNVLAGVSATDQGLIEGNAAALLRERDRLGAEIAILADAHVKHARSLSSDDVALEIEDLALRSGADGVIITGATTGRSVSDEAMGAASGVMKKHRIPIWVGSGASAETIGDLRRRSFGVIVGSALRRENRAGAPLDAARMRAFLAAYRGARAGKRARR